MAKFRTSKMSEYIKSSSLELRPEMEEPLLLGRLIRAERRELMAETAGDGKIPKPPSFAA